MFNVNVKTTDRNIHVDSTCIIHPADVVRDLGVLLDSQLSMTSHIGSTTRSYHFLLLRIRQVKRSLNEHCLWILVQALVLSRIEYCNSILTHLPGTTLQPLTKVLHTAVWLVKDFRPRDHITDYETAWLAPYPCSNLLQNQSPYVQYIFWFLSFLSFYQIKNNYRSFGQWTILK